MKNDFLLAILLLFLLQSCNNKRVRDPNEVLRELSKDGEINTGSFNFTFNLPNEWYRLDTSLQGLRTCLLMKKSRDDNFNPILNVGTESMHGKTHRGYLLGTKFYLANNMVGIEMLKEGEFEVGDKHCLWFSYNKTQNGNKREIVFYTIPNAGMSYNVNAAANEGGMKKYKSVFDQIVRSFRTAN